MGRIESGHKPFESPKSVKGRSSESTNKWKIPHYYKRFSQSNSSQNNVGTESLDPTSRKNSISNVQCSPNGNVMASPRRVTSEGRNRNRSISSATSSMSSTKKTSKKKGKSDMVFVNYTVQDDKNSSQQLTPLQQQEDVFKNETMSPIIRQSPKQQQQLSGSQKSNRRRMLKIFSSSKEQKRVPASSPRNTDEASVALERSLSSSNLYNKSCVNKKSYSSFLKYGRFHNSNSKSTSNISETRNMKLSSQTVMSPLKENDLSNAEFVPKSKKDPTLAQPPSNISKSKISINNMNSMTQSINNQNRNQISTTVNTDNGNAVIDIPLTHTANYKMDPGSLGQIIPQYIEQKSAEDNDASVAFSKLIYQKRSDTNVSSTQALITPPSSNTTTATNTAISNSTNTATLPRAQNHRTASVTSLSSTGSRYSPIRTHSPARPRSSTRGSSVHRLSRDISTIYNANNALHDINPLLETDSFLDSQFPNNGNTINTNSKRMSVLSSASSSNITKLGHRRKQESISDNYKFVSTFSNGNYSRNASTTSITTPSNTTTTNPQIAVTPSGLLLTPPYVTPSMTQPLNSASTASTPSVTELYNVNSMVSSGSSRQPMFSNNSFQQDKNTNDTLTGFNESLPLIKGITKEQNNSGTTETGMQTNIEQQFVPRSNTDNNHNGGWNNKNNNGVMTNSNSHTVNNNMNNNDTSNLLGPDVLSFFVDSSANSSGMESLMTNSLSTANSSIPQNSIGYDNNKANIPQGYQDTLNGNALFDTTATNTQNNNGGNDNFISNETNIMNNGTTTKDEQLLDQMYLEFDFENPNSFFHEQSKKFPTNNSNGKNYNPIKNNNHGDDKKISDISNEQLFMNHKDSTVTSFENASSNSAPSTVIENINHNTSLNSLGNNTENISSATIVTSTNNSHNNNSYNNHTINLMHSRSTNNPNHINGNNLITPQCNDFISTNNTNNNNNMDNNGTTTNDMSINYQDIDGLTNYFFNNIQNRTNS